MDTLTQVQQGPHQARGVRAAAYADARPGRRAEAVTEARAPSPPPPHRRSLLGEGPRRPRSSSPSLPPAPRREAAES